MNSSFNSIKEWADTQKEINETLISDSFSLSKEETRITIKRLQIIKKISLFRSGGSFKVLPDDKPLALPCSYVSIHREHLYESSDKIAFIFFADDMDSYPPSPERTPCYKVALPDIAFEELKSDAEDYFFEARALADFILKYQKEGYRFVVSCEYGVSRSTATAAAILEYFEGRGITIFSNLSYKPNKIVFLTLLKTLKERGGRAEDMH